MKSRILLVENEESIFSHSRSRKGNSKREFTTSHFNFVKKSGSHSNSKKVCCTAHYSSIRPDKDSCVLFFIIRDTFYDLSVTGVKEISS